LQQVHIRFGEAIRRHAVLAHRTPRPYPAVYDDVRNRCFVPVRPVMPVPPAPRPVCTVFQPITPAPVHQNRNMAMLQRNLDEVNKILLLQRQRAHPPMSRPIPVRPPIPPTVSPTPQIPNAPSRLQRHFTATPEPAAYLVKNPLCTECNQFHSPLNVNDFGPNNQEALEAARHAGMEELQVQADKFASDLLQSATEPPARRRRVAPAARRASPPTSPPSASRPARSPSFHRSLEPSPEPLSDPTQHETPGSNFFTCLTHTLLHGQDGTPHS
jgi:hypothetical protein